MNTIVNISAFLRVARLGSFSAAAREMKSVTSVVAKRISQLESEVGAKLIDRSTRGLALTAAGERYLPQFVRLQPCARLDDGGGSFEDAVERQPDGARCRANGDGDHHTATHVDR
jgi:hypothetical protein